MKKIMFILFGLMIMDTAFGVTLCKKTSTAVAVLNKVVPGVVSNSIVDTSTDSHRWGVVMNDGTEIKGKSLCTGMPGTFAEVNTGVADTYDTGLNCYCKMMFPATSYWVYAAGGYATESACESACTALCANYVAGTATGCAANVTMSDVGTDDCMTFRNAIYEAVW